MFTKELISVDSINLTFSGDFAFTDTIFFNMKFVTLFGYKSLMRLIFLNEEEVI